MVEINVSNGQGITQAIKSHIEAGGQKISNSNLSIWQQVMSEVKTAQESGEQIYTGGDDISQVNNKESWKTDFQVKSGQVIKITENVWNKIVQLLTGGGDANVKEAVHESEELAAKGDAKTQVEAKKFETAPKTGHAPVYYDGEVKDLARVTDKPVAGPSEGENPQYDAIVKGSNPEVQMYSNHDKPVAGPAEGENPMYDAIVKGANPEVQMYSNHDKPVAGPAEGENPMYDAIVKGDTVQDAKLAAPVEQADNDEKSVKRDNADNQQTPAVKVKDKGVIGTYSLTDGTNGNDFNLKMDMIASVVDNQEIMDLFFPPFGRSVDPESDGLYHFRGMKSNTYNSLSVQIRQTAQNVMMQQAVYKDLMGKKDAGTELTKAEQSFCDYYINLLDSMDLKLDKNLNLVDKRD